MGLFVDPRASSFSLFPISSPSDPILLDLKFQKKRNKKKKREEKSSKFLDTERKEGEVQRVAEVAAGRGEGFTKPLNKGEACRERERECV